MCLLGYLFCLLILLFYCITSAYPCMLSTWSQGNILIALDMELKRTLRQYMDR